MAILSSCLCCSLLLGSIIAGVYVTIAYLAAFVISIWWIVEAEANADTVENPNVIPIPIPAYLLSLGYMIVTIMSIWMLQGLYKKNEKALLAWVFVMTLFCFPEMGMVVFMSLVHWKITSPYGLTDLVFYILRAGVNLMAVICVQSQYATWRDEIVNSETLKRLEHLHMNTLTKNGGKGNGEATTLAYHNPAFVSSPEPLGTSLATSPTGLQRSYSRASHYSNYREAPPQVMGTLAPLKMGVPGWDPYLSASRESQSEFNAAMFTPSSVGFMPLVASSRSEAALYPTGGVNVYHHNPQSMYPVDYQYMTPLPPPQGFSTQSLDRRRYVRRGRNGVPGSSMDALNLRSPTVLTHQMGNGMRGMRPSHESRSSLGAESDDFRKYRDVAL